MDHENVILQGTAELSLTKKGVTSQIALAMRWQDQLQRLQVAAMAGDALLLAAFKDYSVIMPRQFLRASLHQKHDRRDMTMEEMLAGACEAYPELFASRKDLVCGEALSAAQTELNRFIFGRRGFTAAQGRGFERAVKAVLEAHGYCVEANVRTVAGEIDLMLTSVRDGVPSHHIIECKRRRSKVTLSQVARLHGVRSVLSRSMDVPAAYIVAVSQPTEPAKVLCDLVDIKHVDARELSSWLESSEIQQWSPPIWFSNLSSSGSIALPSVLARRFQDGKVVMLGMGSHFELWDREQWHRNEAQCLGALPEFSTIKLASA